MNNDKKLVIFLSYSGDLQRKLITFDSSPDVIAAIIATLCKVFEHSLDSLTFLCLSVDVSVFVRQFS